ncbi:putative LPS assembly protein LptD [Hymenobacter cheonanensis]|uniref:putative LPS assembly protein LptD n=1 Tax=Hymenobacter sp. CA2-7 TaxID=3063993 RepID=UPI002712D30E|nr:putative LPS assembly protein LptD [Hymenobacter sp. CA2-7]MDO7886790.1 putative LPS assembly protein LptD [Hymenobacter sp. CA2-7]
MLFSNVLFSGVFGLRRGALAGLVGLCFWLLGGGLAAHAQTTTDSTRANTRRAGSVPTQPVRNLNYDRNAPQSPPPPGEKNIGQPAVPGVSRRPAPSLTPDSTGLLADTSRRVRDSLNVVILKRRSQVETTVKYAAKDSIQFDVTTKIAKLYNKANVDYGKMSLKAALITLNYGTNTVQAVGRRDTVKHKMADLPLFKDEAGTYSAGNINYNFKTKKGKIAEVVTQQGEGYIHAEVVKKLPDNDFYGLHGRYTTCNLEHPHFYIEAGKMKVIPGQKVITGPFHMVIADVPLPIGLPFGYFPTPHAGRGSGFIIPTFGQGQQRGYSLTNGGYYWAPNDYIGLRVTGDFYAGNADRIGGYGIGTELTYRKRYKYQGSFRFTYANAPVSPILTTTTTANSDYLYSNSVNTFWISWSHSPTPLPGGGVFSASVQAGSSSYNRVNTLNARQLLSATFNSTISYSKTSRRLPLNYAIQLSQSQNVQTGVMDFTLPNFNLGLARQYPYQLFTKQAKGAWYEQFAVSYNLVAQNRISSLVPARSLAADVPLLGGSTTAYNIPVSFANAGRLLRNAQNGLQHQFQITLPGFALLARHIQVQPSINYGETWYLQRLQYSYLPRVRAVKVDTISPSFERAYSYSGNISASTNFYGTVQFKGDHYVKAIRHKVAPSISYAFSPDLSKNPNEVFVGGELNNFTSLQSAYSSRILDPRQFSRYQGVYGVPSSAKVSQVAFTVQNQIEMKVRNNRDTTGTDPYKKVSLADGIDLALAYNFAADSLKLSSLNLGYRVQVAKKLNVVISSAFSFYQRDSTGRLINRYLFEQSKFRLARLLNANLSLGYQFNPAARPKSKANIPRAVAPSNDPVLGSPLQQQVYADYIDFDIPWEATVSYTASYTTAGAPIRPTLYGFVPLLSGNSITASGSVKLTPNLRLSTSLNYDLVNNTFVYPTVNFYRDLHCWQISGLWIPVGPYRGYNFTIAAKSSLLQDLKLNRNKTILNR